MGKNQGTRFAIILLVVGFLGFKAYQGVFEERLEQGTDLKGGSELVFRFAFEGKQESEKEPLLEEAIRIVQQRVDNYGLKDIEITPLGNDSFSLQVSAREKAVVESIKELVTVLGNLEFRITVEPDGSYAYDKYWRRYEEALKKGLRDAAVVKPEDLEPDDRARAPLGLKWYPLSERGRSQYSRKRLPGDGEPYVLCVMDKWDVGSEALDSISYYRDTRSSGFGGGYAVGFSVTRQWQGSMASLTDLSNDSNKFMAIILNDEVDSAPHLNSRLRSNGEITGGFTEDDAKKLAAVLQAGKLKDKPILVSERTIAAELAGGARDRGILSTMIAFAVVLGLMIYYYYGPGLLANLALLLNLVLLLGVLSWFEAVLTLPGIAGVVLTVGMAVDANILVFERIKEEKAKGRTVSQAVETGYDRALVTIIDANLTTLITAYFLFQIGSGPVRGFGITLAVGILVSMFTALYVTRTIFTWLMQRGSMTEAKMKEDAQPPRVDWMGMKRVAVISSSIAMLAGVLLWEAVPEGVKYDLDFSEGSRLIVKFHEKTAKNEVEKTIDDLAKKNPAYADVAVRVSAEGIGTTVAADEGTVYEIRSQKISTEEGIEAFKKDLRAAFAGKLLPGPFRATLHTDGDRLVGQLTLVRENVSDVWIREALDAHRRAAAILRDPQVEKEANVVGAGSTFKVSFAEPERLKGSVDLATDKALKAFGPALYETALKWLDSQATNEDNSAEQKKAYAERAAALRASPLPADQAGLFTLTDPLPSADRVDPFSARQHRDAAVRAIALSIIGIIAYVAFRFRSWAFGFAAVIALIHDVLVVLGLVALTDVIGIVDARLSLVTVAAFLTLIGYSINDTIVVFDRIRENRGTGGRARFEEVLNKSINQTLRRTIRTTTTTWVVVAILFAFNLGSASALEGFAFILMIGVIVGTYSSIFIASPTLIYLPWLWDKCGKSVKGFFVRLVPYAVISFAGLMVVEWRGDHLVGDWSKVGFTDAIIAIPMGALLFFVVQFITFVRLPQEAQVEPA